MAKTGIWTCTIGEASPEDVPAGSDFPMRQAVRDAYWKITGQEPNFCFSGWGGELTKLEREVVNER